MLANSGTEEIDIFYIPVYMHWYLYAKSMMLMTAVMVVVGVRASVLATMGGGGH